MAKLHKLFQWYSSMQEIFAGLLFILISLGIKNNQVRKVKTSWILTRGKHL